MNQNDVEFVRRMLPHGLDPTDEWARQMAVRIVRLAEAKHYDVRSLFWKIRNVAIMEPGGFDNDRRTAWETAVAYFEG